MSNEGVPMAELGHGVVRAASNARESVTGRDQGVHPHIVQLAVMVLIGAIDKFFIDGLFRCPCLPERDENSLTICDGTRIVYSLAFLFVPAIALFLITRAQKSSICQTLFLISAWIAIALLNGDYVACLGTCSPYRSSSCSEVNLLPTDRRPYSSEYEWTKTYSQICGCLFALVIALAYFLHIRRVRKICCKP